ncbi:MAG: hypothetical protein A2668_01275 [Candidatus Doudnabacteria bacterium RIFCSPHIGHO2_01_FULL_48_180]|nr:MAG: hypothetical protein A2668_01275 [Candidatus Doudnabacteria bacterium RIFCSPHIGHO2_01_FULL_48_180]
MLLVAANFIQHLPEYPAACCGDEWLNIAFLRGAIPRQEGAGFIFALPINAAEISDRKIRVYENGISEASQADLINSALPATMAAAVLIN